MTRNIDPVLHNPKNQHSVLQETEKPANNCENQWAVFRGMLKYHISNIEFLNVSELSF